MDATRSFDRALLLTLFAALLLLAWPSHARASLNSNEQTLPLSAAEFTNKYNAIMAARENEKQLPKPKVRKTAESTSVEFLLESFPAVLLLSVPEGSTHLVRAYATADDWKTLREVAMPLIAVFSPDLDTVDKRRALLDELDQTDEKIALPHRIAARGEVMYALDVSSGTPCLEISPAWKPATFSIKENDVIEGVNESAITMALDMEAALVGQEVRNGLRYTIYELGPDLKMSIIALKEGGVHTVQVTGEDRENMKTALNLVLKKLRPDLPKEKRQKLVAKLDECAMVENPLTETTDEALYRFENKGMFFTVSIRSR